MSADRDDLSESMLDLPTEIDAPESEPPFMADEESQDRGRDKAAIAALVSEGMAFVEPVARRVARLVGRLSDVEELASVGRAALFDAARTFDPDRCLFSAYARTKLRWAMLDSVRRDSHGRAPWSRANAERGRGRIAELHGTKPDAALPETAHASRLRAVFAAQACAMAVALAAPFADEPSSPSPDGPAPAAPPSQPNVVSPEDALSRMRFGADVRASLAVLPPRQRAIVERHYFDGERFDHIAESLGISKSWASRLHADAIATLAEQLHQHR